MALLLLKMLVRSVTVVAVKLPRWVTAVCLVAVQTCVGAQTPDKPGKYVDKLIEGSIAEDQTFTTVETGPETGRRSFHFETHLIHRQNDGQTRLSELGAQTSLRWQTQNYGNWLAQASWRIHDTESTLRDSDSSLRASLSQRNMPVTDRWWMNNTIGTLRTIGQPVMRSRYRYSLPTTVVMGVNTFWQQQSTSRSSGDGLRPRRAVRQGLALSMGRLSRLEGHYGFGRRSLDSRVISGSWTRRLTDAWAAGIEMIDLDGWNGDPDYSGQSVALEYEPREKPSTARFQLVRNSTGSNGAWFEGAYRGAIHQWRYSVWDFDPQLNWLDTLLSNGQRGLWLRYDQTDPTSFLGGGLEINQDDPLQTGLAGTRRIRASGRFGGRVDRRRSYGVRWQWQTETPDFNDGSTLKKRFLSADFYARRVNKSLRDSIEYTYARSTAELTTQIHELTWSREKQIDDDRRWAVTLGAVYEIGGGSNRLRPSISVARDGRINRDLTYNLWARYARDETQLTTATTYAASAQLNWRFAQQWQMQMRANINAIENSSESPAFSSTQLFGRGHSFWFFVRYDRNWGKAFRSGVGGSGNITGLVYFDRNGDGRRQANEAPAPGVRIALDGFDTVVSGPDGRYQFPNVATGTHRVQVDISTVRLPWGVDEKNRISVNVSPRTTLSRDIPLIKTGE